MMTLRTSRLVSKLAAVAGVLAASVAMAVPPDLTAIELPVSGSSIGTAVATVGAAMLIILFPIIVGFKMVKALLRRATSAV